MIANWSTLWSTPKFAKLCASMLTVTRLNIER